MKAVYLTEPRKIDVREIDIPKPSESEILVKVAYCGVCTLEQRLYIGDRKIYYPLVLGHEASGTIVEIGKKVFTHHKVGDKVALDLVNRCHICPACLNGNSNICENRFKKGQRVLGGFSDYLVARPDQCFILPEETNLKKAAVTEPVSCCIRSLKKLQVGLGDDLLIIGAGIMGQIQARLGRAIGCRVFIADIDKNRLDFALQSGCDKAIDASDKEKFIDEVKLLTSGRGVDAVSVTTPAKVSLEVATKVLASCGRINIYTSYNDDPGLPMGMNSLHRIEALVTGSEGRSEKDFYQSVRAISLDRICVEDLITEIYPISETDKAINRALDMGTYRVLIEMEN